MNYLDIIIAIVLIIFAINGHKNGLIREVFALIAFVGGIYGAILFSDVVGNWFSKIIDVSPDWRDWMPVISFILVFIGLAFLINFLGSKVKDLFEALNLGFVDRIGGIVFGTAKGFLLVGVIILLLNFFGIKEALKPETCEESKLYKSSEKFATWIYKNKDGWIERLDEDYKISEKFEEVEKKVEDLK